MKIGILTYHRSHNYGAVLQAFALLSIIKNGNQQVSIIDYWPYYRKYNLFSFYFLKDKNLSIYQKLISIIALFLTLPQKLIRYRRFQTFINKNFNVSKRSRCKKYEDIPTIYDTYIYGSDQIWRYNEFVLFKGFDPVYWGDFPKTKAKKITYAASMGIIDVNAEKEEYIKSKLNNFNAISVREIQLKELLMQLTSTPIHHVLDPVLLCDEKSWIDMANVKQQKTTKNYILLYNLNFSKEAEKLASETAQHFNYQLIKMYGNVHPLKLSKQYFQTAGPIEFIKMFSAAKFVITSSFHGVAFSIIFKKQFFAIGIQKNNSARIESLLNLLGIPERILNEKYSINYKSIINYERVVKIIEQQKKISLDFLKNQLID